MVSCPLIMTEKLGFFPLDARRREPATAEQEKRKRTGRKRREAGRAVLCGKHSSTLRQVLFRLADNIPRLSTACSPEKRMGGMFPYGLDLGMSLLFFVLVFVHVEVEQEVVQVFRRGEFVQAAALQQSVEFAVLLGDLGAAQGSSRAVGPPG